MVEQFKWVDFYEEFASKLLEYSYFCNFEKEDITDAKLHSIVDYELIPMLNRSMKVFQECFYMQRQMKQFIQIMNIR